MDEKITDERMNGEDEHLFPSCSLLAGDAPGSMSVAALAARCVQEMDNYRRGEPSNEQYCLELLRRAIVRQDAVAWEAMQRRFSEVLLRWICSHPKKEAARQFDSDENYVARAFERFWQATAYRQQVEFTSLAAALRYLHACLNAAIMDTLRTYSRPREIPLPEPGDAGEQVAAICDDDSPGWEVIQTLLTDKREHRLAYLLFYCGLKPRDIVRYCPLEYSDVQEIYRRRRNIFDRLIRNIDYIRWKVDKRDDRSGVLRLAMVDCSGTLAV